ncbi:MAG: polysaccharide deacetylase family protein [Acidiferrobacteraceae bacterium]
MTRASAPARVSHPASAPATGGGALMYHDLAGVPASGFEGAGAEVYKLERSRFDEHLQVLAANFPAGPSVFDGVCPPPPRTPFVLTFDDGGISAVDMAGRLERRGWHGHFFITTAHIGGRRFLKGEDIRALRAAGHVIGSHSATHPPVLSALPDAALRSEWQDSRARLEDLLGERVITASVPGGYCTRRVVRAAEAAGVRILWTSEPTRRVYRRGQIWCIGRYAVYRHMNGRQAAALAGRSRLGQYRQWVRWNSLKPAKMLLGAMYPMVRRRLLAPRTRP